MKKIYSQLSLKQLFKGLFFTVFFLLISNSLWSQTYNLRFVKVSSDGSNLIMKVQASLSSPENMGSSNLVFTYDATEVNTPVLGTIHNFSGGNYQTMTLTSPATNTVSLNIELSTDDAGTALATGAGFTDVAEISFTLPDGTGTANFQWLEDGGTTKTVVYQDDNATRLSAGTLTNNDMSVVPSNNAPTDIVVTPSTVNQSTTGTNSTIGTLSSTDADGGDSHTYTEVAGTGDDDNGSFNISGSTLRADGALAAGVYSVRINTNDGTDDFAQAISVTVTDDVAPSAPSTPDLATSSDSGSEEATAGATSDNLTNDFTPTFTGTAEADATVKIISNVDGVVGSGTATGGNYSITVDALTSGAHTITATATDAATNASGASSALAITIDSTQPTVAVTTTSTNPTNDNPIPITITFSEEADGFRESDITTVNGLIEAFSFASADSTIFTFNLTPSGDGAITVNVNGGVATDRAGNNNTAASQLGFTYDGTAPTVTNQALAQTDPDALRITYQSNETGTLYYIVTTNSSTPTQAQIKAGNDQSDNSTNVVASNNAAVTVTGSDQTIALNSLTLSSTTYHLFLYQEDGVTNESSVVTNSVVADVTAPTFDSGNSTPNDNATGVATANDIVVDFSENIAQGTGFITIRDVTAGGNFESYDITTATATVSPAAGALGIMNDKLYINPNSALTEQNDYSIRIDATAITDATGNSFAGIVSDDVTFNFTTADETNPTLTNQALAQTAADALQVTYQSTETGTLYYVVTTNSSTPTQAQIKAGNDQSGTSTNVVSSNNAAVTVTGSDQTVDLTSLTLATTTYHVYLYQEDASSNESSVVTNSAAADATAPTVSSSSPADDATGVDPDADITVTFNEDIAFGTGFFQLIRSSDDVVLFSIDAANPTATSNVASISGAVLTINPGGNVPSTSTGYYLKVFDQTPFLDLAGNAFTGFTVKTDLNFTTIVPNSVPSFTIGSNQTVSQSGGAQTISSHTSGMTDNDGNTQTLTFNVANDNNGIFDVQPDIDESSGNLTFTPKASTFGKATVTVSLSDDGGTASGGVDDSGDQTFDIFITPDNIKINEVHASAGADAEFIEVYNTAGNATSLSGLVMVWFNGDAGSDVSYKDFDLTGSTSASGFYVIGETAFASKDQDWGAESLQNGPDAVAIYVGSATDFTTSSTPTTDGLVDVIVYGGSDDAALRTALGNPALQVAGSSTNSISRTPDGTGGFVAQAASPQATNDVTPPTITSVSIPNSAAKVADAITVTIAAGETGLSLTSGSVNGVTVTGFSDDGGGSYSATYTVVEGNTDRAAGDDVPVSFILTDGAGNSNTAFTTVISQASDAIDANSPSVTSVTIPNSSAKVGDAITVSITAVEAGLSLNSGSVNGVTVTGFSDDGGGSYSATYTVAEGNTDRAAGDDVPVSFVLTDGGGNNSATFTTAIAQASDAIDANSPSVTSVTIPNASAKVGDAITVSITAGEAGLSLNSGSVNGVTVTGFSDDGGGSYSATYTVVEGNTDRAAGDNIPVSFILADGGGNNSATFTTAIAQASDAIDANSPSVTSVTIPNSAAKVGDAITVSITAGEAGLSLNSGSVNGVAVTGFSDDGGGSYSATYTVAEGNTDRAAGDDVPVSFVLTDGGGNNSATFTTAIAQASDAIDANSPSVTSVTIPNASAKVGDAITVSITAGEAGLSLNSGSVNGVAVTGFSDDGGGSYSATYTVAEGNTDRAAGDDVPVSFVLTDGGGNNSATFTTAIAQASDAIDANSPSVTSVTIPNSSAKVGDAITVSITASEAGLSLNSGSVNGVTVTGFSDDGGGSYSATYTVVEGNTDRAAGDDVPVSFILTDGGGNNSATFTTAIAQASDAIDANSPSVTSVTIPNASAKVGDAITVSITAGEAGLSLNSGSVNGVSVTGFSDDGGGSYSATYTVAEGNTNRAAGDDIPVSFVLNDAAGNSNAAFTTAISQGSDAIDANSPSVTSVTIPNSAAKVGDAITVSITASEAGLSLNSGQVNGVFVTGFSDDGGGSYSATYTVVEGNTDRAAGDDVPVSFILIDGAGNTSATFNTAIAQASDAIDANSPLIASVFIPNSASKVGSQILVQILAEAGLTLNSGSVNGVAVTTFSDLGGGNYTAVYTVVAGNTDRAAGDDIPVNFIMTDGAGNNSSAFATAISQASDPIDASAPTVTSVSIPNSAAKVGDAVTVSITAGEAGLSLNSGSVNGVTVTGFSDDGGGSYSATYTVVEGNTDRAAGDNIPVSFILADGAGNTSATFTTAIAQASDAIDANSPTLTSTSPVDDATNAGISGDITLTFSENIAFGTGNIKILDFDDNTSSVTIDAASPGTQASISGNVLTLSPTNGLELNTNFIVQLDATAIDDGAGNSFAGITDLTTFNFTTVNTSVAFSSTSSNGSESTSSANLEVALNAASASTVTVAYAVTGTATGSGTDFTLADGTLTFNSGDVTKNITIASIVADVLDEANETVIVTLSNPTNVGLGTNTQHTYTINDDDPTPTVAFNATASNGAESVSSADLQVDLSAVSGRNVTVNYAITGTATGSGTDYTLANGTLIISAGDANKNITIASIVGDVLDEADETVIVTLSNPTNATLGTNTVHTYTINDDDATPTVAFNSTSSNGAETTTSATLQVDLSAVSGQNASVDYTVSGTATGAGTDYTLINGTLNFTAGDGTEDITIASIVGDALDENDETVIVTLSNPVNATLGTNTVHTYTILDDDASPSTGFVTSSSNGDEGTASATLAVALSGQSGRDITLDYTVTGTATGSGTDYTLTNGTFTIEEGLTNKNFTIPGIVEDALDEDDETIIITLSNPVNAILPGSFAVHTYTITDNDALPTVAFGLATDAQTEDQPSQDVQVSLNAVSGRTVTVDYAVSGTATAGGTDHTTAGGTITFNAGDQDFQQQIVGIVDDLLDEENETIILTLSNPTNATLGTQTTHTYTITDNDDAPTVTLTADNTTIAENGGTSNLTATLSAVSGKDVAVTLAYSGTATNGTDYNSSASTLITVTAGQLSATASTIITSIDDADGEGNETIIVDITGVTNGTEATPQTVNITITDDDAAVVTSVASSTANGNYKEGDLIAIQVTFSQAVNVTGTPQLTLETGSTDQTADYASGDGTSTLTFNYTVIAGDVSTDLDYVDANSLMLNGGTIIGTGLNAILDLPAPGATNSLGDNAAIIVDTSSPVDPIVTTPATSLLLNAATQTVSGTHGEDGVTINLYADSDNNGVADNTTVLATTTVSGNAWSLTANLTGDAANNFVVQAADAAGNTSTEVNVLTIIEDSTSPVISSDGGAATAALNVNENATAVTTVMATDANAVTYTISGGADQALFSMASGVLSFTNAPDFESPGDADTNNTYVVEVTASDGINTDDTQTITVTVVDQDDNSPVITSDGGGATAALNVNENATAVTTVMATDADGVSTVTYSISGGADQALFSMASGVLTFTNAPDFESPGDADTNNTYVVEVTATDGTTTADTQTITVTVVDQDDNSPVITSDGGGATAALNVNENATAVTTVTATDADGVSTVTYSISGGADQALFSMASGVLSFTNAPDFESPGDADTNNTYVVEVTATDGTTTADTQTITVTVVDQDDNSPVITSDGGGATAALNVNENATAVTTVMATDADGVSTVTYSISGGADQALFSMASGVLSFTNAPDFESPGDADTNNTYVVEVTATDGTTTADTQTITVTVVDLDDNSPVITSDGGGATAALNVNENATAVTTVMATDADGVSTVTYSISGGADQALFSMASGVLSFTNAPDFESPGDADTNNTYVVEVTATDGMTTADTQTITVTVVDQDDNSPVITSDGGGATAALNVNENATAVTTVMATDADGVSTVTYSISGGVDQALFSMASGVLTFTNAPDFESPGDADTNNTYVVEVTATDGTTTADTQTITVTVVDQDDNSPVITSDGGGATAALNVNENATAVTTVTATDADIVSTVTYSISGGADQALFSMASGVLTFTNAPDFESPGDADTNNTYVVEVTATDGTTTADTQTITVTVVDLDDNSPVITSDGGGATATVNVNENSTAVTTVTATDADGVSTVTYSISGGADQALFSMVSGVLSFTNAPDFEDPQDTSADNEYRVEVTATDGTNTVDTQRISVMVVDLDDNSPVITSDGGGATATVNVNENSTAVTTVTATDADGVSTVTYSISGGPDQALFSMVSGVLSFTNAPDFEDPQDASGDNEYRVEVTATDGTNTVDIQRISVMVVDLNDNVPVITAGQSLSVQETAANSTSVGTVVATDPDAGTTFSSWTITAGNSAGIFAINAGSGEVTVADNTNLSPKDVTASYTLTLTASDGTNTSATQTVTINILDSTAPAAPLLVSISNDSGADAADGITNDNTLSFSGTAEANSTVELFIDGSSIGTTTTDGTGNFTFDHSGTTLPDGTKAVTAKATDASGNQSASSSILSITVDTVVPVKAGITGISDDNGISNSDAITNDGTLIYSGTAEPFSTVTLVSGPFRFITVTADANGDWVADFTSRPFTSGLTVVASTVDAAGNLSVDSDPLVIVIDVVAPTVASINRADPSPTAATSVDYTVTFDEEVHGLSTGNFGLVFTGTQNASIGSISASSGTSVTVTVNNITGEGTFGLNLTSTTGITDVAGNALAATFTGELYATNNTPTDIGLSSTSILENNAIGDAVGTLSTTDIDAGDTHTYSLVSGTGDTDNGSFSINGGQLQAAAIFDLETKASYDIRLQTNDGSGGVFQKAFTITIDNVAEADLRITGNNDIPATPLGISTNFDITVHNDGDAAMSISSILYPAAFGGPVTGINIAAGASQVVTMTFTPTIAQLYTGNITIVTNGGTGILAVSADGAIITGADDGVLRADAIKMYPNPASDVVTMDLSEFNGRPLDIQLFDISGTKAFGVVDFRETTLKLDVKGYQQGIYLVYFTDGKSTVQKKLMIRK